MHGWRSFFEHKKKELVAKLKICALIAAAVWLLLLHGNAAAAAPVGCKTHAQHRLQERPLMQIFANLLRWLVQGGARKAHVKRADDLLKKLSRSLQTNAK